MFGIFRRKPKLDINELLNKMSNNINSVKTEEQFFQLSDFIARANQKINKYLDSNPDDTSFVVGASYVLKSRYEILSKSILGYVYSPRPLKN